MKQWTYPHSIDNGAGEVLTFVRREAGPRGERLIVTNDVNPGIGPPMHVHHRQDECLTVVEGRIGYQSQGQEPRFAGPGETVTFKAGDAHRFWNAGDTMLRCEGFIEPIDNIEYFLAEIFMSTKANGGHRPGAFDSAYLLDRYGSEFDMLGLPGFVRKVIFPVSLFFGKLMGKHRKFADAPEPVR